MYHYYGSAADLIMDRDFDTCANIYKKTLTKINEERLFLRWINGYQHQISFDDFKNKLLGNKQNSETKEETQEEIYEKVKAILEGNYHG